MAHPVVPPTTIVPAWVVVITTEGVVSVVGVVIAVVSEGVATAVSRVNGVSDSALASFPAESVKVIVQLYSLSPPDADRVTVCWPEPTAADPTPHPDVPPTVIVPAWVVVITTSGVASLVGVVTTVVSEGVATALSRTNAVRVRALAAFPAESVKVIVHV